MSSPLDPNPFTDRTVFSKDAFTANATFMFAIASMGPAARFRVERCEVIHDTTYVADPANYYILTVQHGATVIATWSTQTGQQGTITAAVPGQMVLAADVAANLVVQPSEVLTFVATKVASGANITARVVVHGRFVQ